MCIRDSNHSFVEALVKALRNPVADYFAIVPNANHRRIAEIRQLIQVRVFLLKKLNLQGTG